MATTDQEKKPIQPLIQEGVIQPTAPGQEVQEISQLRRQLGPDQSATWSSKKATPELVKATNVSEEAAKAAVEAKTTAALGVSEDVAAAQPPPTVAETPMAAPSGEGATGGIPLMPTRPQQEDANRAAMAALAKEQSDAELKERDRLNKIADQRAQQAMQRYAMAEKEYNAAKNPTTLKEDKGFALNILSAIAAGLGAYGSAKTGTPNFALQILENEQKADDAKKRAKMEDAFKAYQVANKNLSETDKAAFVDKQMGQFLAAKKAKLTQIENAAKVTLGRFPDAQNQVLAKVAEDKAKLAEDARKHAELTGIREAGGSKTTKGDVAITQAAGTKGQPQFDKTLALHGGIMDRAIKDMESRKPPSSAALAKMQDNQSLLLAAVNESKTTGGAVQQILLRKFGVVPRISGAGVSASDQIFNNDMSRVNTSFLRLTSGAAIKDDEFIRMADELLLSPSDSPELRSKKMEEMRAIANDIMGLSGKAGESIRPKQDEGAPASTTAKTRKSPIEPPKFEPPKKLSGKELGRLSPDEREDYVEAQKVKPGSKDYTNAQAAIRKLSAKARGE